MSDNLVTETELAFFYSLSYEDQQHFTDQVSIWDLKPDEDIDKKAAKLAVETSRERSIS